MAGFVRLGRLIGLDALILRLIIILIAAGCRPAWADTPPGSSARGSKRATEVPLEK